MGGGLGGGLGGRAGAVRGPCGGRAGAVRGHGEGMCGAAVCRAEWRQRGERVFHGEAVTADRVWWVGSGQAAVVSGQAEGAFRSFRAGSVRNVTDRMAAQKR